MWCTCVCVFVTVSPQGALLDQLQCQCLQWLQLQRVAPCSTSTLAQRGVSTHTATRQVCTGDSGASPEGDQPALGPPHACMVICSSGYPITVLFVPVVVVHRADPFVEVGLSEKGEHLLGAAGEVHLETVVKDLKERFARVPFQVRPGGGGDSHDGALKHTTVNHTHCGVVLYIGYKMLQVLQPAACLYCSTCKA